MLHAPYPRVLLPLLTLILSACGGSPAPGTSTPGTPLPLSATVEGYSGSESTVTAKMQTSLASVASGTITAEGRLDLELPGSLTAGQLATPAVAFICVSGSLEYSAPDASVDLLAPLEVSPGSEVTGTLELSNRASDAAEGTKTVYPIYSSVAQNVSGVCNEADFGRVTTYNVTLEPGWNYVLLEQTDEAGTAFTNSSVTEVPADVTWRFFSAVVTP